MPTSPPSITALPSAPDPSNRTTFNTLAYPWSAALPTFGTQVSAVGANVKANADEAQADAVATAADRVVTTADRIAAAASASTATTQAGLATTNGAAQVSLATTQANTATTQAGIATTQAGIATTKAGEANASAIAAAASAASIAGGPVASVNGMTGVVTGLQAAITGAATTITTSNLTASRALVSDASGKVANHASVSAVELGYLDGVTSAIQTQINAKGVGDVTLTGAQTLTNKTLTGYTETVYALAGTVIDVANGTIQTKTLSGATTFTESLADGQSVMLGITAGAHAVTWPTTVWAKVGGSGVAPTLTSTGVNWVILWQTGGTLRGAFLGTA